MWYSSSVGTVRYARTNVSDSRNSIVIASVRSNIIWIMYRGNPFQAHSLEQSYHQKYKCKKNIKLIYLAFIHCTCKFEKFKQSFLSENYDQTFPNKKRKQYNAHESINNFSLVETIIEHVMHVLFRPIVFLFIRSSICVHCNILILLIKTLL
jgi:hypothetical protein